MLENRIKRLAYEAARSQKVTDSVTQKAEKLLEARERHYKEIEEKQRLQELRQIEIEKLRIRNLSLKQESNKRKEMTIDVIRNRNKVSKN